MFLKLFKDFPLWVYFFGNVQILCQQMSGYSALANTFVVSENCCLHFRWLHQRVHDYEFVIMKRDFHFLSPDGVELNVKTWVLFAKNWNWLVHSPRSCTDFSLESDAPLNEFFLGELFRPVGVVSHKSRAYTKSRWTGNTSCPGDVTLNQDL